VDIFEQAKAVAHQLTEERDELRRKIEGYQASSDIDHGIKQQLQAELESARMALSQAQGVASGRMAMIYELSAQLSTLGLFANTIAGEIRRILEKVNEIVPPKGAPKEDAVDPPTKVDITQVHDETQVEIVGSLVGDTNDKALADLADSLEQRLNNVEGDTKIPFVPALKRRPLLSSTVTQSPAFLHRNGKAWTSSSSGSTSRLSPDIYEQMSYREKRNYHKTGSIPERFNK